MRNARFINTGGRPISPSRALAVLAAPASALPAIFLAASALRRRRSGDKVRLCAIVNAKSGACSEDCAYCAQSARHRARCEIHPLLRAKALEEALASASKLPVSRFGIVTSGAALSSRDINRLCAFAARRRRRRIPLCASLGCLDLAQLRRLRKAGVRRYHHNLETAESFFPRICTTHSYARRLATIRAAKKAGMEVCSGGIFGMGESRAQRVELALALSAAKVDSIPLNFLVPIPGTPLQHAKPLKPADILRTIAMFRLTNPAAEIKVCAGRCHLRGMQSMIFHAGADGMMIGPLLTVAGGAVEDDLRMLDDLELRYPRPRKDPGRKKRSADY